MNYSVHALPFSSSSSAPHFFTTKRPHRMIPRLSFSAPRRRRPRAPRRNTVTRENNMYSNNSSLINMPSSDDQNIGLVLDVSHISSVATSGLHRFLICSREAYLDLQNLVTIDDNRRIVVSCRRTTMQLVGSLVVLGFVVVSAIKVLAKLGSAFKARFESKPIVVVRRDRSLGGREVVVGITKNSQSFRLPKKAVSPGRVLGSNRTSYQIQAQEKLPKWWPVPQATRISLVNKEEYQREANRLIRVIMDNRTSGKDIMEDEIIQLRRICRTAGVGVSIDPTNTRDSFYRTSVDFILNVCSRAPCQSTSVQIDDEDAREFIAGLAENIGLENIHAARMVSAAVAARTRSCFLQAWALEMQGKNIEAVSELSKICVVHRVFPPEESSPEMEMVARGLEKLMKFEERKFLMNMFVRVCGEDCHRSAAEALDLVRMKDTTGTEISSFL